MTEKSSSLLEARIALYKALQNYLDCCVQLDTHLSVTPVTSRLISDELSTINSGRYGSMLQQAKVALCRAANKNHLLAPIGRLPPEILARIFAFTQTCSLSSLLTASRPHLDQAHRYPLPVSQVCSQWRNVAISSCDLWSHIDIVPFHPLGRDIFSNARYSAFRASPVALDVHIEDRPSREHSNGGGDGLAHFITSFGDRVRSLELRCFYETAEYRRSLGLFLTTAVAGTLENLTLIDKGAGGNTCNFFAPMSTGPPIVNTAIGQYTLQELDMTLHEFENLLLPLTTLHLSGIYPYWNSQAYHGLTELRLLGGQGDNIGNLNKNTIISDVHLANILHVSPGLRVFHFGLAVHVTSKIALNPAYMKDLEFFRLEYMEVDEQQAVLGLINPGQSPLHMICGAEIHFGTLPLSDGSQFNRFFMRSHVTRLSIKGMMSEFHIFPLLPLLPRLQLLALSQFIVNLTGELEELGLDSQTVTQRMSLPSLERLHFLRCDIHRGTLQLLVETVTIKRLTLSYCQHHFEDLVHFGSSIEQVNSEGGFGEDGWDELL